MYRTSYGDCEKNSSNKVSIAGIHMEGPYLNIARNGIHVTDYIRPARKDEIKQIVERAGGLIRVWTLAPDIAENMDAIETIAGAGVSVSIAHTEAGYETAMAAFSAGANRVTHTFNTMPAISHRYTGIVTAAWQHGAYMELIADGQHVSPTIARMFIAATDQNKIVLVSDNNEFSGLPDGNYIQDNRSIIISNDQMKTEAGVLAGSLLCINRCALNVQRWGFPTGSALKMASENPARAAGIFDHKGSIALGKDADIAILNGQFESMMTIKGGEIVYQNPIYR
jgi:N-acetylglucosamine-6-phosphate deacetylase